MLNEKRINEAANNIEGYIADDLLKKTEFNQNIFNILKNNAQDSLKVAIFLEKENRSDLWVIVISYYAMYYIANAVLYKLGYKIGHKISHKITADALIVFVRKKLADALLEGYEEIKDQALSAIKSDELIETFDFERRKRSTIQYQTKEVAKHSKAQTSLKRAKEFMFEMEKLLE